MAFVSLDTVGQSPNKAALRVLGTLLGMIVAFVILALFAQERWGFILVLSVFVGFCTYSMGGRHAYVWMSGVVVCSIVALSAGIPSSAQNWTGCWNISRRAWKRC